jgi:hypothetical protein
MNAFKHTGYLVIRNLIGSTEAARFYEYTLENLDRGNKKDEQALGSPSFYQDEKMSALHQQLLPKIEELIQLKLFSTFCYHRTYREGAILRMHKDRRACEITTSLNLGQKGDLWDLWLLDADENAQKITLAPGDALIYRGCKLTHWRGKLINADFVSQVFFHFVDKKGPNKLAIKTELLNRFLKKCRKKLGIIY